MWDAWTAGLELHGSFSQPSCWRQHARCSQDQVLGLRFHRLWKWASPRFHCNPAIHSRETRGDVSRRDQAPPGPRPVCKSGWTRWKEAWSIASAGKPLQKGVLSSLQTEKKDFKNICWAPASQQNHYKNLPERITVPVEVQGSAVLRHFGKFSQGG